MGSLSREVSRKALALGAPFNVQLDITYRCNERCGHCYLDHDDHGEMTTAEIRDVLNQLAEAGAFRLPSAAVKSSFEKTSSKSWNMPDPCCSR